MANSSRRDFMAIFSIFIGAIITVVFLASITDTIFPQTNTGSSTNQSVVVPAINGTLSLAGREVIGTPTIINVTNIGLTGQGLSVETRLIGGANTVVLVANDTAGANGLVGSTVNVTYSFNPDGFISDSGARSITNLIPIFGALAIVVFIIVVLIANGTLGAFFNSNRGRRRE